VASLTAVCLQGGLSFFSYLFLSSHARSREFEYGLHPRRNIKS
jgi:hypothetical protein